MPGAGIPSGPAAAAATTGGAAGLIAFGGTRGLGNPYPPPGGGGRASAPGRAGAAWPPAAAGGAASSCAIAGILVIPAARNRSKSVKPECHSRNALPAPDLLGLIRARRISLATLRMVVILVRTEVLARQRVALVQEKADPRTGAEHAEAGFDLHLLGVMGLDNKHDLPDQRGERRGVAARHTGWGVDDDITVGKPPRHFGHQGGHLIARKQFRHMRSTATGREDHQICDVRPNQHVGQRAGYRE